MFGLALAGRLRLSLQWNARFSGHCPCGFSRGLRRKPNGHLVEAVFDCPMGAGTSGPAWLALNILMLIWPLEAVRVWQAGG
jgi:hypothetical protein